MDEQEHRGAELVLYATQDGTARFFLRTEDGSVWLTQAELAELFQTSPQNITQHVGAIYDEGELRLEATCKQDLQVRTEGARQVRRTVKLYNLDMILAIGYRVKSPRGTQFRQWATAHLKEYLVKGFVMDDERLKGGDQGDYFDELLRRIRDIRASEKRFYQKVRDLFALSIDYADDGDATAQFFAEVQNKMFYAVTRCTAAELVVQRADPSRPNMALTSWKAGRVRKADVIVAKNYLDAGELDHLNRIVTLFLDFAELRTTQRKNLRMADWRAYVDSFMEFNDQPVLKGLGRISHQDMTAVVNERYEQFDAARRKAEALEADQDDMRMLEQMEKQLSARKISLKKGGGTA
ncbi:virulence RhuM family protein [Ramlibacter sp.]|uniref:virulence RhuM family protein n=1 Tax=Ramlibacter sp. TaxID=1917967 RepID=UPI00182B2D91|nr:virulence RhuM family protein [Ramlibacter sp.]MBA2675681.1 virulence RhuM family protein [Ramlibacter sp.]